MIEHIAYLYKRVNIKRMSASAPYATRISRTTCVLVAPSSMMRWPGRDHGTISGSQRNTSAHEPFPTWTAIAWVACFWRRGGL